MNKVFGLKKLFATVITVLLGGFIGVSPNSLISQPKLPTMEVLVSADKSSVSVGDIITLTFSGKVPSGCYVYSTSIKCDVGPNPPDLALYSKDAFQAVGEMTSEGDKIFIDDIFNCQVGKFTKKVLFRQKVKVLKVMDNLSGNLDYQMCSDDIGVCLPRNQKFSIALKSAGVETVKPDKIDPKVDKIEDPKNGKPIKNTDIPVIDNPVNSDSGAIVPSIENLDSAKQEGSKSVLGAFINNKDYIANSQAEVGTCDEHTKSFGGVTIIDDFNKDGLWGLFLLAFIAGFAALITPCVFPMIPMTVTYFLKQSKSRGAAIFSAVLFGLFIIIIYEVLGLIFAVAFGPETVNYIATAWLPNVIFFTIFLLFAFSFFGAFEITLPASLTTSLDQKADKGGYLGIFFMALTLAVVSFSCTGPIVATVLVQSADGEFLKPLIAMGGFALAFALPFMLAAIFPSMLNSMPKSGGWLNAVKVCLGFIEIAFGLKFLSTADQTYHWGILDREVYLAIWITLFILMGLYLMGKMKFSHDSELKFISIPRLMFIIVTFSFVFYLIPGLWGAPLKALSGYLPPMGTQDFKLGRYNSESVEGNICDEPMYGDQLEIPLGLKGYFDYDQALSCAYKLDKPLFLDFTGHGCVNCRKMEESVWDDPRILKVLREDYVVVSLYVDDKKIQLPESEHFISKYTGDMVTTLGKKNATIQQCLYGILAQPQYVLIDYNQNLLAKPQYSDFDAGNKDRFLSFLQNGVKQYQSKRK